tara:strand:+ start:156 stop:1373 length:1218 start_codon:yes stop_codon:yes gene_type:complete
MAIKVNGTTVINDSRALNNIASIDATTKNAISVAGIGGHRANTLSGASVTLDVGSYNFFYQDGLTANTTIAFSNVPTSAKWSYNFKPEIIADEYDITKQVFLQSNSLVNSGSGQLTETSIFFKPDGLKMFILNSFQDTVDEYELTIAWDSSTAAYKRRFYVGSQASSPLGLFFKPDGLKMYVVGSVSDAVREYTLSTAWNVTSASYDQGFSIANRETQPQGVFFKPDGTVMYTTGSDGDDVNQFNLSTAWSISTAVYSGQFVVSSQESAPVDVHFSYDGQDMYVIGNNIGFGGSNPKINHYILSTAWNITSATWEAKYDYPSADGVVTGVYIRADGKRLYISANTQVHEYQVGTLSALQLPSSVLRTPSLSQVDGPNLARLKRTTYDFITSDSGTTVTLIGINEV